MKPHAWLNVKWMPWIFCNRCGLVRLGNRPSQKAANRPCPVNKDDK